MEVPTQNTFIYVLKLENRKYYVGKTNDLLRRFNEHQNGNGAEWTKKYKVVHVERVIENAGPFDEDKYTKETMAKYGIENVRGGSYVMVTLPIEYIAALENELKNANNCCVRCGMDSHYVKNCPLKSLPKTEKIPDKENRMKKWTIEEKKSLATEFDSGMSISQLATLHSRTTGAIEYQLASIGKIDAKVRDTGNKSNHMKKWTLDEKNLLMKQFDSGMSISQLAALHSRTTGAIECQLASMGKIDPKVWHKS